MAKIDDLRSIFEQSFGFNFSDWLAAIIDCRVLAFAALCLVLPCRLLLGFAFRGVVSFHGSVHPGERVESV